MYQHIVEVCNETTTPWSNLYFTTPEQRLCSIFDDSILPIDCCLSCHGDCTRLSACTKVLGT